MVLAGAGSGKTKVLTTRAVWLIEEKKLDPEQLLLVTFTNKAAGEMRERVEQISGRYLPHAGTFHSFCAKLLRRHAPEVGLSHDFSIYDSDDQLSLIKRIYKEKGFDNKRYNIKAIKAEISKAKNEILGVKKYAELAYGDYQEHAARVYKLYENALSQAEAVDFDDLLLKTIELFKKNPNVLTRYQNQFLHVLVDEYQDTNTIQYFLTKNLAKPQQNLFVVGDFSQSIYAWRGANYKNMLSLKDDYPDMTEYRLEQNYRSTQSILDTATHIISQNTKHPILSLWTESVGSEPAKVIEAVDGRAEAEQIMREITNLNVALNEIAILYRTNAQSRAFEEACLSYGISYRLIGGFKFYERREVKDALAMLRLLSNPKDTVSFARVEKLGKRRLRSLLDYRDKDFDPELSPAEILQAALKASKYEEKFDSKDPDDIARLENIQELLAVSHNFDTVTEFLENVALVQDSYFGDHFEKKDELRLTLMSLHAAKGLEFSAIFMVGMEEGLLPHSRSLMDAEQIEEERRLCYVGVTRAKKHLYFSYARKRFVYGSSQFNTVSRFLFDLPTHLLSTPISGKNAKFSQNPERFESGAEDFLSGDIDVMEFLDS